jgi:two-component system cell cycle sensor histidine kinase/response regulator CckA
MMVARKQAALFEAAPRLTRFSIAAMLLAIVHIASLLVFAHSSSVVILSDFLVLGAALFTAIVCLSTSCRSYAIARPFWRLTSLTFVVWSLGKALLMYDFYYLGITSVPIVPLLIFFFSAAPMFVTLFLSEDNLRETINWEGILDAVQILSLVLIIYLFVIYIPWLTKGEQVVGPLEDELLLGRNILLAAGLLMYALVSQSRHVRRLYMPVAIIMGIFASATWFANRAQAAGEGPEVAWYDLAWSIPFCLVALTASMWQQAPEENGPRRQRQRMAGVGFAYLPSLMLPAMLLAKIDDVSRQQIILALTGLIFSIVLFSARLALARWRQGLTMEALNASEIQYRSLFERNMAGVYRCAMEGKLLDCNPAFASMFGYTREELLRLPMDALYFGGAAERTGTLNELRASAPPAPRECCFRRKDGSTLWVVQNAGIEKQRDGSEALEGTLIDITERKLTNLAIEDWKRRYDAAVLASRQIIFDWDPVSRQVTFGGALEEVLGYSPRMFVGGPETWRGLIHPDDLENYIQATTQAMEVKKAYELEYRVQTSSGEYRMMHEQGRSELDLGGNVSKMVGFMTDVSERRMLEQQLRQAQKMEAVGRLAGGVAHDFNNLLTIIMGYSQIVAEDLPAGSQLSNATTQIKSAATRAAEITRQLLAFSRKQVLSPRIVDLNDVVLNLDSMLRRLIGEDIEVHTVPGANLGSVKADPGQIEQVLMNLAINARDAMPGGGKLTLETANVELNETYAREHKPVEPGRYVMLAVSDTGVGMSPETQAHIFEPFYTTKEIGKGTGLGLSTVFGIVKQSGGYIWVYSEPGHGSTFKIYFPRMDEPAEKLGAEKSSSPVQRGVETILLVEDDAQLRQLASSILDHYGYRILAAASADEALELCKAHHREIKLLITDVVMPGMNGRQLAELVAYTSPQVKVLYISGYTSNAIVHQGVLDAGIWFLPKPFSLAALVAKVREVLDDSPDAAQDAKSE